MILSTMTLFTTILSTATMEATTEATMAGIMEGTMDMDHIIRVTTRDTIPHGMVDGDMAQATKTITVRLPMAEENVRAHTQQIITTE